VRLLKDPTNSSGRRASSVQGVRFCRPPRSISVLVADSATSVRRAADVNSRAALLDVGNLALLIDNECGAISYAPIRHQYAVGLDCFTRYEIAKNGKGKTELLSKFTLRRSIVGADSKDLCVSAFKLLDTSLVSCHFFRSATGKRCWEKRQHNVLLSAKVGELYGFALRRGQFKIRRRVTHLEVSLWRWRLAE
jgi:hypothetical protein